MLQRSLSRSLQANRSILSSSTPAASHVCSCNCGRLLSTTSNRNASSRRAPITRNREQNKSRVLTADERRRLRDPAEIHGEWVRVRHSQKVITADPDNVLDFLSEFEQLFKSKKVTVIDPDRFFPLLEKYAIDLSQCQVIARCILIEGTASTGEEQAIMHHLGKKLLLSCSRAGVDFATIHIMAHSLFRAQSRNAPAILLSPELKYTREHLTKMAESGHNYKAQVVEGKIALLHGDEDTALRLFTNATLLAVETAQDELALKEDDAYANSSATIFPDKLNLSTPWIDLFQLHATRARRFSRQPSMAGHSIKEWNLGEKALQTGCQQDDPDAHFHYAQTYCREEGKYSTIWLYSVTKAAASGHTEAAYELGKYFAESEWKYIDQEPPDYIKPTPLDSYPPPRTATFLDKLKIFVGLETSKLKPSDHIFLTAMFPSTAVGRWSLAMEWFKIASAQGYAPASWFQAVMHMQETIDKTRNAPKDALELKDSRYTYRSEADRRAGIQIVHPESTDEASAEEVPDPANHLYNLDEAKRRMLDIFDANEARKMVRGVKERYEKRKREGRAWVKFDDDELADINNFKNAPERIKHWLVNPHVREKYEHNGEFGLDDLLAKVQETCDENKWDLFGEDGGLVYRAKRELARR